MTPLTGVLLRRIAADGPLTVADYMRECLLHPEHGYYATRDPLGVAGDFTTSPEISQMFGEVLGLCLAQAWVDQGRPARIALAELGPGRGTLMADVLRATRRVEGFHAAAEIHLVEASQPLRARQAETLADYRPCWHAAPDALPAAPLFLLANEFFDALPVRQFVRAGDAWRERVVGASDGCLVLGLSDPAPLAMLEHRLADTAEGDIVEIRPGAAPVMREIAGRLAAHGGAALVIDYGGWRSAGDTLQAVRAHAFEDPLLNPGAADLTAHVDFEALATAAEGVRATGLTPQGVLLERLGITARAQAIASGLDGDTLDAHIAAHRRLTHPEEMGNLFMGIGFHPPGSPPPPGFDP